MSKITNGGLILSGVGRYIAVPLWWVGSTTVSASD